MGGALNTGTAPTSADSTGVVHSGRVVVGVRIHGSMYVLIVIGGVESVDEGPDYP